MSTRDRLKEVKVAQKLRELQAADSGFQPLLVSGTNIKTINGSSVLGSGNLVVGGGGYAEGTSFPVSPTSGDKFYRTDLNWLCFYDGTRWLTAHEYDIPLTSPNASTAGDWTFSRAALRADRQIYLTTCHTTTWHLTAPSALNYWTIDVSTYNASRTKTTLFSFATSSYASGMVARSDTLNTAVATTQLMIEGRIVETGGAPNVLVSHTIYYRLIVT